MEMQKQWLIINVVELIDIWSLLDLRMVLSFADKVFGQDTNSQEVYEVAAKPVVKAAMEGVNGMAYCCFNSFVQI